MNVFQLHITNLLQRRYAGESAWYKINAWWDITNVRTTSKEAQDATCVWTNSWLWIDDLGVSRYIIRIHEVDIWRKEIQKCNPPNTRFRPTKEMITKLPEITICDIFDNFSDMTASLMIYAHTACFLISSRWGIHRNIWESYRRPNAHRSLWHSWGAEGASPIRPRQAFIETYENHAALREAKYSWISMTFLGRLRRIPHHLWYLTLTLIEID